MNPQYFSDVMSGLQKFLYWLLVIIWLIALIWFWNWWLGSNHLVTWAGFVLTSFVLFWSTVVPAWFFFFAGRMKRPNPELPLPQGRVAMIVTRAPSEPWSVVRKTLVAMLTQNFPESYDVWLADEDPTPKIADWCLSHGVFLSCRKNVEGYHNKKWPRRRKCKEGNLCYFYDSFGYDRYDFVVQMDADHVPEEDYLIHMIAPFINPDVGYVAAPSICDANFKESWTVRGRLFVEASLHGSLQAGYNGGGFSPICIGSHYAVRTQALQEAGGLGPELAEDHSTTLMINNAGWDGAFAFDAIAHGDGAGSFAASMTQEFQWSRSLTRIFFEWRSKFFHGLTFKKRLMFLFAELWYPIFALQMTIAVLSPEAALIIGSPWVSVNYVDFIWRYVILTIACLMPIFFVKAVGAFRPKKAPVMSWETVLFQIIRWPWVVIGCLLGFIDSMLDLNFGFKVTPKGDGQRHSLGVVSIFPYILMVVGFGLIVMTSQPVPDVSGYRWLALLDVTLYTTALLAVVFLHLVENYDSLWSWLSALPGIAVVATGVFIVSTSFSVLMPQVAPAYAIATPIVEDVKNIITTPTPTIQPTPTPVPTYVGIREQLGPTPTPTLSPSIFKQIERNFRPSPTPSMIVPLPSGDRVKTGMYDPQEMFADKHFDYYHVFTDWNFPETIGYVIDIAQQKDEFPLITVQPIHRLGLKPETLLTDITAGKYDDYITQIAKEITGRKPQKVMLRWGHEMDLCYVYDWSPCRPKDYIAAYKYVVDKMRSLGADNVYWMWSPGGNRNAPDYYPGDDYVDYVGVTLLVSEDWDNLFNNDPPHPQGMIQALGPRYRLLSQFNKPFFIAELSVSYHDPNASRLTWLKDGFKGLTKEQFPLLEGWVFYDDITQKNPRLAMCPDFRVTRGELITAMEYTGYSLTK